jgi:SAM-dependent methyltransferase
MKKLLLKLYSIFSYFLFDPISKTKQYIALPFYVKNLFLFKFFHNDHSIPVSFRDLYVTTADQFMSAGVAKGHYFFQDLWAAKKIYKRKIDNHIDIGSRIDGFIAHILPFCNVSYVDIRPLSSQVEGLSFINGSIINLPFEDNSISSLSCLHVIEHIGLGRYGDPLDPQGHSKAARELSRVLAPGGHLYIGTPVGKERVCFDAHRVFDPESVIKMFSDLDLLEFSLIDDSGDRIISNATTIQGSKCNYGCGLFLFTKS